MVKTKVSSGKQRTHNYLLTKKTVSRPILCKEALQAWYLDEHGENALRKVDIRP